MHRLISVKIVSAQKVKDIHNYNIKEKLYTTLSGTVCLTRSTNYTSNNLPRMQNQRLLVQF